MSTEETPRPATNNDLLRDLQRDLTAQGLTLARFEPQLDTLVELGKQTQAQVAGIIARAESSERDMIGFRARLENVEARPAGLSSEQQGEIRSEIKQALRDGANLEKGLHELSGKVQNLKLTPPLFDDREQEEIRRLLRLALKHDVDDAFTPVEMETLHDVAEGYRSRQTSRNELHIRFRGEMIALAGIFLVTGFVIPYVQHLLHLH